METRVMLDGQYLSRDSSAGAALIAAAGRRDSRRRRLRRRRPVLEPLPMPEILKRYVPISAERLKNPPDGDWPMIRRTYDGWGYSPLSQIDTGNVDAAAARVGVLDLDGERTRGAADRRQRRDVRVDAGQSGSRH